MIGSIGAVIGLVAIEGLDKLQVDDPVGKQHVYKDRNDNIYIKIKESLNILDLLVPSARLCVGIF